MAWLHLGFLLASFGFSFGLSCVPFPPGFTWILSDFSWVSPWLIMGPPGFSWVLPWLLLDFSPGITYFPPWVLLGFFPPGFTWVSHGCHLASTWLSPGFHMVVT
ncbi:hypothetical protein OTU49_015444 [Cherax quadricarinatus]|uniref:Secreted protein n=1 Tax=Cherax quadricarinatus TaxID=27406 RepID=A0AAW0YCL2_CHEQU